MIYFSQSVSGHPVRIFKSGHGTNITAIQCQVCGMSMEKSFDMLCQSDKRHQKQIQSFKNKLRKSSTICNISGEKCQSFSHMFVKYIRLEKRFRKITCLYWKKYYQFFLLVFKRVEWEQIGIDISAFFILFYFLKYTMLSTYSIQNLRPDLDKDTFGSHNIFQQLSIADWEQFTKNRYKKTEILPESVME